MYSSGGAWKAKIINTIKHCIDLSIFNKSIKIKFYPKQSPIFPIIFMQSNAIIQLKYIQLNHFIYLDRNFVCFFGITHYSNSNGFRISIYDEQII